MLLVVLAGSIGTVSRHSSFGIPALPTPFGMATPEIPFVKVVKEHAYASLRLVSADHAGAQAAPEGASVLGRSYFDIYTFLFLAFHHNNIYPGESRSVGSD